MNLSQININKKPFFFRDGTSDAFLVHKNFLLEPEDREYLFPMELNPKVVLDIGANIGVTSVLLTHLYPEARIYAFEPEPTNFEILKRNAEPYPNIHVMNVALGNCDRMETLYKSTAETNHGGFAIVRSEDALEPACQVQVRDIEKVLTDLGIEDVDLIKIDVEGAEKEIIKAINVDRLRTVKWFEGEMHDKSSFWLMAYLEAACFEVATVRVFGQRVFPFRAKRHNLDAVTGALIS